VGDDASPILAAVARKKERKRERVQFERKLQSTPSEAEEKDLIAKLSPSTFSILATKSPKNLSGLMTTSLCKTTSIAHFTTSVGEGERERKRDRVTDTCTYIVREVLFFYNAICMHYASKFCCRVSSRTQHHHSKQLTSTTKQEECKLLPCCKTATKLTNRKNQEEAEEQHSTNSRRKTRHEQQLPNTLQSKKKKKKKEEVMAAETYPLWPPLPPPPSSTVRLQFVTFCILYRKMGVEGRFTNFFCFVFCFQLSCKMCWRILLSFKTQKNHSENEAHVLYR
jgi:hypothetical protein